MPYPSFQDSSKCLDNKRLWKQVVECYQIIKTLHTGPNICSECRDAYPSDPCCGGMGIPIKTPWYNHPAVQMWKEHERCLGLYAIWCIQEWKERGYKDSLEQKINLYAMDFPLDTTGFPSWWGNESFHSSHRSALLRKNFKHYSKFGWTESLDLPYVWPTK